MSQFSKPTCIQFVIDHHHVKMSTFDPANHYVCTKPGLSTVIYAYWSGSLLQSCMEECDYSGLHMLWTLLPLLHVSRNKVAMCAGLTGDGKIDCEEKIYLSDVPFLNKASAQSAKQTSLEAAVDAIAWFHPSSNYLEVQPVDGGITFTFHSDGTWHYLLAHEPQLFEHCQEMMSCSTYGNCVVFCMRKEMPLPCAADEVVSFAKK
ncbi:hypothetical protein PR048_017565 [Dryococelus australis]|uniref:Uncharacterized protein n=1 Tax=Dryococelus australis TaxID=614101 RepID=A0ABQ9H9Y0_9NEOP|nr:hypothetical protein PR048_017565 [Dryococelus australis]